MDASRRSDLLLLLTSCIWGFAFVAQRAGMADVGPFLYNAVRFALGVLVLVPFVLAGRRRRREPPTGPGRGIVPGLAAGVVLFAGASLQQAGLVATTAGNAGFVTGLYVVLVPLLGALAGRRTPRRTWTAAVASAGGLALLTSAGTAAMAGGDLLVLAGAFFWALHILVVSRFAGRTGALDLAVRQFAVCSVLSLAAALATERIDPAGIVRAALPLAYGGFVSVGIAYTLQVVAQRHAHPAHAAVIMSLETVFAALGGALLLGERMTPRGAGGCAMMLGAMLLSAGRVDVGRRPVWTIFRRKDATRKESPGR